MVASVLACLVLVLLPLCFSNSCTQTLPCNPSLQIMPPFYIQNDIGVPNCQSYWLVGCDKSNTSSILVWHNLSLPLENISYNPNIIHVQDPYLAKSLDKSSCANLYFNFTTPVTDFHYEMYERLSFNLSSMRCKPSNQIQSPPAGIFEVEYNLSFSSLRDEDDVHSENCRSPPGSPPSFECIFSFDEKSGEFSLLSASYSRDLRAQPGCFANSMEISGCQHGKGECSSKRKKTIIGSVVGSVFLLSFLCLLLLLYKHKKLRSGSSSSEHLVQREFSDQYFHDLEMAGLGYMQIFSYEDLEEATEGFDASKELGAGGFGTVYKGILKDGRTVAVKLLYKNNYKRAEQFMNEVEILSRLHHPNLVNFYGCSSRTSHELLLVYEFVPNGTVADHLHGARSSENALTWPVRLSIAIETANALAYLHAVEPPIIHRDVKSNNILLDDRFHVKVADFGLSRLFPLDVTHVSTVPQGTPGYVDPVYHQCYHLTDKSDVYSFGVVLVELISSKLAVDLDRSKDEINLASLALNKIQMSQLEELVDPALGFRSNWEVRRMVSLVAELAFRCLQYDREMRPPIKEVYETLKEIEQGNYSEDELLKEHVTKEETYLLKCDPNISSSDNITTDSWRSSSTTPNTSG